MSGAAEKAPPRPATLADLLALPEEGRGFEILDGQLVEKETSGEHGRAQSRVNRVLGGPFDRRPGGTWPGGWWFATEVLVDFGPERKLRPDVCGWRRERLSAPPSGKVITDIPDWVCEIVSTSNARQDKIVKMRAYHEARVAHYWIVDPRDETLAVYRWTADGYLYVLGASRGERVRAEPFAAIEISVGVLFGDDEDE